MSQGPPSRTLGVVSTAPEPLDDNLLRRRAKSGVFFVGSMGAVNLLVGLVGNIVIARTLLPRDFGIVALGAMLMMFTTSLADGGLGSGLIRRERAPERHELRTALGLQLTLTVVLAAGGAAVGALVGGAGLVVALMMLALPIATFQTPGRVVLSRALKFRALSTAEAAANFVYYAWAVAGVVAGMGVWALASAVVIRAIAVSAGVMGVSRLGVLVPSYRGARAMRSVIAFGLRFQAVSLAGMGREQSLNVGIAAIGGVSTLGLWTLTKRLLEFPILMFEPLHRVSFPFMSHVLAARQDPSRMIDRGIAVAATASGAVLVAAAASAPELIPTVFGEQWREVAGIFQWVCAGLLVSGPLAVVGVGFLYAADDPSVVLRATLWHTIALLAVAFALLPAIGPMAIGIGSFAGAVVDAAVMGAAVRRRSSARPERELLPAVAIAAAAGLVGTLTASAAGHGLVAAIAGGAAGVAAYVALTGLLRRRVLVDTVRLFAESVRSGVSRERPAAGDQREPVPATAS
jgi:O-antigen/teichoic acid export membrane protein